MPQSKYDELLEDWEYCVREDEDIMLDSWTADAWYIVREEMEKSPPKRQREGKRD